MFHIFGSVICCVGERNKIQSLVKINTFGSDEVKRKMRVNAVFTEELMERITS